MSLLPIDLMDVKFAVAIDFGRNKDPLAPVWIHFYPIDDKQIKNTGTGDFDKVHAVHEELGFGSMVTSSFSEYQYLLNVIELPVIYVDEKQLPKILSKEATTITSNGEAKQHKWMMTTEDDLNSNWNWELTPNSYYRSFRLARQIEHLKKMVCPSIMSMYDMNNEKETDVEREQLCKLFEKIHFKLSVY